MKKALIAIISLLLILAMYPVTAYASDYQPRLTAPSRSDAYYSRQLNRYSQTGYGMPNCVAYAYGRVYEITGEKPLITHGSAGDWWYINKRGGYYDTGITPKQGAVAVWSGHVAVVEIVNDDGSFTVSESHYGGTYFDTKTFSSAYNHYGQTFLGFIYTYTPKEEPVQYKMEKAVALPVQEPDFSISRFTRDESDKLIVPNHKLLQAAL